MTVRASSCCTISAGRAFVQKSAGRDAGCAWHLRCGVTQISEDMQHDRSSASPATHAERRLSSELRKARALEALAEDIHPASRSALPRASTAACISSATPWEAPPGARYVARHRPKRLGPRGHARHAQWRQRDRRPPEAHRRLSRLVRAGRQQLGTERDAAVAAMFRPVDYPVGIIAGDRSVYPITSAFLPKPHDGQVSVENTKTRRHGRSYHCRDVAPVAGAELGLRSHRRLRSCGMGEFCRSSAVNDGLTFRRRKSRMVPAISCRCVSSAKWPVS